MSARITAAVLLSLVFGCCAARAADSVPWHIQTLSGVDVHVQYPVVAGPDAARLNPLIQRWLWRNCQESPVLAGEPAGSKNHKSPKDCVADLSKVCAAMEAEPARYFHGPTRCAATIGAGVAMDAAGLLVIGMNSSAYTGGAHGSWTIAYLNLDLHTGRALDLDDLLKTPYADALQRLIVKAIRRDWKIPSGEPLTQGGFNTDDPFIPDTVEIEPRGLDFVWQLYDIAPYAGGTPDVLVSYADLASLIRKHGPLARLSDVAVSIPRVSGKGASTGVAAPPKGP